MLRRALRYGGLPAVAVTLALGLSNAPASLLDVEDPVEPADAALVMTGDPGFERTKAAARLVREGTARLLVTEHPNPASEERLKSGHFR